MSIRCATFNGWVRRLLVIQEIRGVSARGITAATMVTLAARIVLTRVQLRHIIPLLVAQIRVQDPEVPVATAARDQDHAPQEGAGTNPFI